MTKADLSFIHRFEPASDAGRPPLLLLHGTGGDEDDLLPLGRMIAPGSALLSPRGKILEGGMPGSSAGWRRACSTRPMSGAAPTSLPISSEAREAYGLAAPVAVGFSNGANIAAAVLALRPEALAGAVLLRAMVPLVRRDRWRLQWQGRAAALRGGGPDHSRRKRAGRLAPS